MLDVNRTQSLAAVVPTAKAEGAFLALAAGDALGLAAGNTAKCAGRDGRCVSRPRVQDMDAA